MHATIKFCLSPIGQKQSILAGGNGKEIQSIQVEKDDPLFKEVLEFATVGSDGSIVWDRNYWDSRFDVIPTVADLLADWKTRVKAKADKEAAEKAEQLTATLAVLSEKKTRTTILGADVHGIKYFTADWPWNADKSVVESPAAIQWLAELQAGKEDAIRRFNELLAQQEKERREALGMEENDIDLSIEDGALASVPKGCWESHSRGKNWLAIINISPSSPGGLARDFATKAKGSSYYLVPTWQVGDAVEFGADYYSGGGRKRPTRWYGFVVRILPDRVILRETSTGKAAVKEGKEFVTNQIIEV